MTDFDRFLANQSDASANDNPALGEGQYDLPVAASLRAVREAKGLHIEVLAAQLKVSVKKLEALEAGRYGELPDLTFARALALSACRHLKTDPAPILAHFPDQRAEVLDAPKSTINTPFRNTDSATPVPLSQRLRSPSLWVVLLLLGGAFLLWTLPHGAWLSAYSWLAPSTAVPSEDRVELIAPALQSNADPVPSDPALANAAQRNEPTEGLVANGNVPKPPPVVTVDASYLLQLRANKETWIEVVNGRGAVLVQRTLQPGDTLQYTATPPYKVAVGRPGAVEVWVRGEVFDLSPYRRNRVARFEVQ